MKKLDVKAERKDALIVTRHSALVEYLRELMPSLRDAEVRTHVTEDDVRGRVVFGVLPLHLAALAKKVVVVPLNLPPELRGSELNLEQVKKYAGEPQAYIVRKE